MFWMSIVLLVSFSAPVHANTACQISNFQDNNGKCQPCPSNCTSCVSGTNCTECEENYWGLTCQTLCTQPCPEYCSKEYGHCTYGCRDGTFVHQDLANCTNCTSNCEICSSATECIRCKPRFYGPDCRSCPNACVGNICNMTTGACIVCGEGYFSRDGICQKCPDGCASCNDAGNCTKCDKGFYGTYNGKCSLACRNTDTSSRFLASSEDRCGIPNGLMSHDTQICANVSGDQAYTCRTHRYCLTDKTCSSDNNCSLNQDEDNSADVCLMIRSEVCFAKCQPPQRVHQENITYQCNQTCKVRNKADDRHGLVCFHDNTSISSNGITLRYLLSTIYVMCLPDSEFTARSLGGNRSDVVALTLVSSLGLVATCTSVTLVIRRCKLRRSIARATKHSSQTNDEHVTTDLEVGGIPRMVDQSQRRGLATTTGMAKDVSTLRGQSTTAEEYTTEANMTSLRNMSTVQHEERANTDISTGITSLMNQPSVSREEYMTLGVDVEVHNYERLETRDSYEDCEQIQPISESDVNSRAAKGTRRDYLTPRETVHTYGNCKTSD